MRHIKKEKGEPASFTGWKRRNRGANWDDFSGTPEYHELKTQLVSEQDGFCCYCELAVEADQSSNVEHLKPKGTFTRTRFTYANLLASCVKGDSCNAKKQGWYCSRMVTPLQPKCQSRFTYTQNGQIIPARESDSHAQKTIKKLGLNCRRLRGLRESIIKGLESAIGNYDNPEDYLRDALDNCRDWYHGFYTVFQYVAAKMGIET